MSIIFLYHHLSSSTTCSTYQVGTVLLCLPIADLKAQNTSLLHSLSIVNGLAMNQSNEESKKRTRTDFKSQGATNFPAKLHFVLESLEKDGQADIMSWQPHGRAFMIRDKARLVAEILPA